MLPYPQNRTITNPRQSRGLIGSGFTLVELLVVVAIIVILMGILIPLVASARTQAKIAATKALLTNLNTALQSYYNDFNMYPSSATKVYDGNTVASPSGSGKSAYPNDVIPAGRGPCMLAQGLMGYLPFDVDGCGPKLLNGSSSSNTDDPSFGFRVGNRGRVYGPYMSADTKHYRTTSNTDQSFIDPFGNEILYYRAVSVSDPMPDPMYVFGSATNNNSYFIADDNTRICDAKGTVTTISGPNALSLTLSAGFFESLGIYNNVINNTTDPSPSNHETHSPAALLGRDSYLLVSAGPDGKYFTKDDIVATKP